MPQSVYAKVAYGFRRNIAVEDEVTAVVDYGDGATGVFVTATHDLVGTDRFEILGDSGKIVVENSKTATVTRLSKPERELSDGMDMDDVMRLFTGQLNIGGLLHLRSHRIRVAWGSPARRRAGELRREHPGRHPLIAPGSDGINGVRLANAIHLVQLDRPEVPLDFDEDEYLIELNQRIRERRQVRANGIRSRWSVEVCTRQDLGDVWQQVATLGRGCASSN